MLFCFFWFSFVIVNSVAFSVAFWKILLLDTEVFHCLFAIVFLNSLLDVASMTFYVLFVFRLELQGDIVCGKFLLGIQNGFQALK